MCALFVPPGRCPAAIAIHYGVLCLRLRAIAHTGAGGHERTRRLRLNPLLSVLVILGSGKKRRRSTRRRRGQTSVSPVEPSPLRLHSFESVASRGTISCRA